MRLIRYFILLVFLLNPIYSQCDGDSNLDDSINIQDIILIINHVLEENLLDGAGLSNSDTNDDETVDILDIIIIINIILLGDSECELRIDLSLFCRMDSMAIQKLSLIIFFRLLDTIITHT